MVFDDYKIFKTINNHSNCLLIIFVLLCMYLIYIPDFNLKKTQLLDHGMLWPTGAVRLNRKDIYEYNLN